ncbi:MAG: hypothetical protein IPM69_03505 [Ignavibacteria bacterium]|nr:hypothetical protein [Ignavibacteria bacterium]
MKKEAVGSITKSGGFSRVIREVHESGEPVQIIRNNEIVAMVVPANADLVSIFDSSMNFGKILKEFSDKGMTFELQKYLLGQIITGIQAQALLLAVTGVNLEMIKEGEQAMVNSINEIVQRENAKQQEIANQQEIAKQQKLEYVTQGYGLLQV